MENFYIENLAKFRKYKNELEKELNLEIKIDGKNAVIEDSAIKEYEFSRIMDAINFGFTLKRALLLKEDNMEFKTIHIKDHTKRNLRVVKARLIGKKGKTKRVLADVSDCEIIIKETEVGIIGEVKSVEDLEKAIISLIKGSKQSNIYQYLERMNAVRREAEAIQFSGDAIKREVKQQIR